MNLTRTQWNLLANLAGQASNAGFAFLVFPWFVHYLGQEAFGVVGFHISLQATMVLFDFGISVAANRELARLSSQPHAAHAMRTLVASLQRVYWLMAFLLGGVLFVLAPILAEHWLKPKDLSPAEVAQALRWMALAIALQWPAVLYANCLSGLQRQSLLNGIQFIASLGRFPGTLLLLVWSPTLDTYFANQCYISLAQTIAIMLVLWRILPADERADISETIDWKNIRVFAAAIGSISVLNLILVQYDKLLLSTLLPLTEFGNYALASTLVGGLGIVSMPIGAAVFPRFSQLVATNNNRELREMYHHSVQLLAALLLPLSVTVITFADTALFIWSGNQTTADNVATVLRLLTIAMTLYWITSLPNTLQVAHGETRLMFWLYVINVAVYLPLGYAMARWAGGEGAAAALAIVLLGYLVLGVPILQRRVLSGDAWRTFADIALPLTPVLAINLAILQFDLPSSRVAAALVLIAAVLTGTAAALAIAPVTHDWLRRRFA